MIAHALTIVVKEIDSHFVSAYGGTRGLVALGNMAEGIGQGGTDGTVARDKIILSVVNIKEEKALKNLPNYVRNDASLRVTYENPPVYLNFLILFAATHTDYTNALLVLSRAIRFFQSQNVFTQDSVAPSSLVPPAPWPMDELESFKLIFDLYSPTMEEVNHLWGTLGGKQYPFVLYMMRVLDLKYRAVQSESGLITEIVTEFNHKKTLAN